MIVKQLFRNEKQNEFLITKGKNQYIPSFLKEQGRNWRRSKH